MVNTESSPETSVSPSGSVPAHAASARVPLVAVVALVLLAFGTWFDGAFALADWAPLGVLAVCTVIVLGPGERARVPSHGLAAALWAFAAWSLLSVAWSDAPSLGVESAARNVLFAALATVVVAAVPTRTAAVKLAQGVVAVLGLLGVVTLGMLLLEGKDLLLAGRLDDPVGYRNGAAALMAMAAVALVAVAAAREVRLLWRSAAFGTCVVALGLAFLTQSRGVALGLSVGVVVLLVLGPDRLRRGWLTVIAVALVALASRVLLGPYDGFVERRAVEDEELSSAVLALVVLGFAAGALMALLAWADEHRETPMSLRRLAAGGLVTLALVGVAGGIVRVGNPVSFVQDKVDEFTSLEGSAAGGTRLGSVGGQRYDLYRIAWDGFAGSPLYGLGEGGYVSRYYAERATDRNLSLVHSLPLQVLGETGAIGFVLLFGAFVLACVAVGRGWSSVASADRRWAAAVLAAAAVLLSQSFVDWLFSIAALAGLAVLALAVGLRVVTAPQAPAPVPARGAAVPWRVAACVGLVVISALFVSAIYVRVARADRDEPAGSLSAARTAERFAPMSLTPRYLQAGALEGLGDRDGARQELLDALEVEPRSFVTLSLLGDLETRADRPAQARRWYRRALALNPRDVGLQQLAAR